ncbi:hypothetical protein SCB49_07052 [unidentified eubacterium SCB49]|nr:hypothetical protein SCB49_07052 [unidentified eubacterium SCB49]
MSDETNKNIGEDLKDDAKEFANDAKNAANDFKENWNNATDGGENKKILAGVLAIVLGSLGVHKFILGYNKEGLILLGATVITCGFGGLITSLVGLVEGIIYLTKSDEEFYQTYQVGKKTWF